VRQEQGPALGARVVVPLSEPLLQDRHCPLDPAGADGSVGRLDHELVEQLVVVRRQADRAVVVGQCLSRAADRHGGVAGLHARGQGRRGVARGTGVSGKVRGSAQRAVGCEDPGKDTVDTAALAGEEVVVDRLGEERVAEGVALRVRGDEDVLLDGLPERPVQLRLAQAGACRRHCREQRVGDTAPRCRGQPDDVLRGVGELLEPHHQQPREIITCTGLAQRCSRSELFGEEGVALGAVDHRGKDALAQPARAGRRDDLSNVGIAQGTEIQPAKARNARPDGEGCPQRVLAVEVVASVGGDERERPCEPAREQEGEEVTGGLVGPVHVLHHQEDGSSGGELFERRVHRLEHGRAVEDVAVRVDRDGTAGHQAGDVWVGTDQVVDPLRFGR
jgi:hypothetical protein